MQPLPSLDLHPVQPLARGGGEIQPTRPGPSDPKVPFDSIFPYSRLQTKIAIVIWRGSI